MVVMVVVRVVRRGYHPRGCLGNRRGGTRRGEQPCRCRWRPRPYPPHPRPPPSRSRFHPSRTTATTKKEEDDSAENERERRGRRRRRRRRKGPAAVAEVDDHHFRKATAGGGPLPSRVLLWKGGGGRHRDHPPHHSYGALHRKPCPTLTRHRRRPRRRLFSPPLMKGPPTIPSPIRVPAFRFLRLRQPPFSPPHCRPRCRCDAYRRVWWEIRRAQPGQGRLPLWCSPIGLPPSQPLLPPQEANRCPPPRRRLASSPPHTTCPRRCPMGRPCAIPRRGRGEERRGRRERKGWRWIFSLLPRTRGWGTPLRSQRHSLFLRRARGRRPRRSVDHFFARQAVVGMGVVGTSRHHSIQWNSCGRR